MDYYAACLTEVIFPTNRMAMFSLFLFAAGKKRGKMVGEVKEYLYIFFLP